MSNLKLVSKAQIKLFNSLGEYKEYLNSVPEHGLSMPYEEMDVKEEVELIEELGFHRKTVIIAKVGDKLFRVFGNETVKAINEANTELLDDNRKNYGVTIIGLQKEEHITDLVEGVKVQYSFS